MASLVGKVIAVTGAASGIGLETARLLFKRGASLALADIKSETLDTMRKEIAADHPQDSIHRLQTTKLDVVSSDAVAKWCDSIMSNFGKLNGACNFAGISGKPGANIGQKPFHQLHDEDFDAVMNVNVKGVFNCVRAEVQHMMGSGGSIVNAASVAGLIGIATGAPYATSKASYIPSKTMPKVPAYTSYSMQ